MLQAKPEIKETES